MSAPDGVAIVIPMLNEAAALPRLIRKLAILEPQPQEIIAVDSGSTDASVALVRVAGFRVIGSGAFGSSTA